MKLLFSKRTRLRVQLALFLLSALALLVCDKNYSSFKIVRYYLDTMVSPLYYISNSPKKTAEMLSEIAKYRDQLIEENAKLTQKLVSAKSNIASFEYIKNENNRLRGLLDSPVRRDEHKMATEVLLADTDPYVSYIALNKGKKDGVYEGQPVVDEKGVVGQVYEIAQNTSRAILVCDRQHAIPVQILRNGIRMVATGNGCDNDLTLDFLPNSVDIKVGDVLVTSGLGGGFPEGYPVAVVNSVKLNTTDSTPLILATPSADLKRLRYLLLLWGKEGKKENDL